MRILLRWALIAVMGIIVTFCFTYSGHAFQGEISIQPEITQIVLRMAGFDAEIIDIGGENYFNRILCLNDLQKDAVFIGFPKDGIAEGTPFLLSTKGAECVIALNGEGAPIILVGSEKLVPAGVLDLVKCIFRNIRDLIGDVADCGANPFCIVRAVLTAVFNILACLGELF